MRTCRAQNSAPMSTSRLPQEALGVWEWFIRYIPATERKTAKTMVRVIFCPFQSPIRGTITTYNPVMKPACPAPVQSIPTCCRDDAENSNRPRINGLSRFLVTEGKSG